MLEGTVTPLTLHRTACNPDEPVFDWTLAYAPGAVDPACVLLCVARAEPQGVGGMNYAFVTNVKACERGAEFWVNYYLTVPSGLRRRVFGSDDWPLAGSVLAPGELRLIERRSNAGRLYFSANVPGSRWNGQGVRLRPHVSQVYSAPTAPRARAAARSLVL